MLSKEENELLTRVGPYMSESSNSQKVNCRQKVTDASEMVVVFRRHPQCEFCRRSTA